MLRDRDEMDSPLPRQSVMSWRVSLILIFFFVSFSRAVNVTLRSEMCVVYAEEEQDGISIYGATASDSAGPQEIAHLTNHTLPTVGCQPNYAQCDLSCFPCHPERDRPEGDDNGEEVDDDDDVGGGGEGRGGLWDMCCVLPVVNLTGSNGIAMFHLTWSDQADSQPSLSIVNISTLIHGVNCVIGHIFPRDSGDSVAICINTTSNSSAYIWFRYVVIDENSDSLSFVVEQQPAYHPFSSLPGSLSLSETHHLPDSYGDCFYQDNFFFIAQSFSYTTVIRRQQDGQDVLQFGDTGPIQDCWYPIDVGYIETNILLLRVQCSQFITKLVTACGSHETVESYDSRVNGTVYQCKIPGSLVNVTLKDGHIKFTSSGDHPVLENMTTSSYPFSFTSDIAYGYCTIVNVISLVFGLHNGSVYSFSFATGSVSMLARNSCNGSTINYTRGSCYKAHTVTQVGEDIVEVYDYSDSVFVTANLSCPGDPIVGNITVSPRPPMAGIIGGSVGPCRSSDSISEATTTPTVSPSPASNSSLSDVSPSSMALTSTVSNLPRSEAGKESIGLLVGIAVAIVFFVIFVLIIVVIACFFVKKWKRKKTTSNTRDVDPLRIELRPPSDLGSSLGGASNGMATPHPSLRSLATDVTERVESQAPEELDSSDQNSETLGTEENESHSDGKQTLSVKFSSEQSLVNPANATSLPEDDGEQPKPKPQPPHTTYTSASHYPMEVHENGKLSSQAHHSESQSVGRPRFPPVGENQPDYHHAVLDSGNPGHLQPAEPPDFHRAGVNPGHLVPVEPQPTSPRHIVHDAIPQAVTNNSYDLTASVSGQLPYMPQLPSSQPPQPPPPYQQPHLNQNQQQQQQPQPSPDPSTGQQNSRGS